MAFQYLTGQVAMSDPYPNAPTVNSQRMRESQLKLVRLTSANFTTTGVNTLAAVLPADASIIGFRLWTGTVLSGGGVTSPLLSIGSASAGTQFANAFAVTNTAGSYKLVDPATGLFANYQVPLGSDVQIWVRGTCSTGNPTGGELFLLVEYIR